MNALVKAVHVIRKDYHKFETEPSFQLKYHRRMTIFWINNFLPMNVVVGFDIWGTMTGHDKLALLMTALLLAINTNYSLYANLDTEIGDAHGAYAGVKAEQIQKQQKRPTLPPANF